MFQIGSNEGDWHSVLGHSNADDVQIDLSGQYEIILSEAVIDDMHNENISRVKWHTKDSKKRKNGKLVLSWHL